MPGCDAGEVFLLLLIGSENYDGKRSQGGCRQAQRYPAAYLGELLDRDGKIQHTPAHAAVFFLDVKAAEVGLCEYFEYFMGKFAGFVVVRPDRLDFFNCNLAAQVADHFLLFG